MRWWWITLRDVAKQEHKTTLRCVASGSCVTCVTPSGPGAGDRGCATLRLVVTGNEPPLRLRRRARSDEAILAASRALLEERGVAGLTIEAVAERSGVAKTTIYRRWRDRDELALAVLVDSTDAVRTPPDVGDTRKELLTFVTSATRIITENGTFAGLASEIATRPELGRVYQERVVDVRLREVGEVIARGIERGDLRADTNVRLAHEMLVGPRIYRLLFSGAPLDRRHATRVVDAVMTAFAA
jgi:AcrR family transcriptional regulator